MTGSGRPPREDPGVSDRPPLDVVRPSDERPHPPGAEHWRESWWFDFATADGLLGGWVRFTRHRDHAWYEAMLTGPHRQLLAVVDHEVPFRSNPLEVRTTGLWADHICESPLDHWTVGLEAFAVGLDDPLELYGRALGDQVPLGLDVEWETDGPVVATPAGAGVTSYVVPCRVFGEVLVGAEAIDLEAVGSRSHTWGPVAEPAAGWALRGVLDDGGRRVVLTAGPDATTLTILDEDDASTVVGAVASLTLDGDGLPASGRVEGDGLSLDIVPIAATPLVVPSTAGPVRQPRALCRLRSAGGVGGVAWLDVLGPVRGALDG